MPVVIQAIGGAVEMGEQLVEERLALVGRHAHDLLRHLLADVQDRGARARVATPDGHGDRRRPLEAHIDDVGAIPASDVAGRVQRLASLDATAQVFRQRLPGMRRAHEGRRNDGLLHVDRVEREHLERLGRPHRVGVELQPAERSRRLRPLVGDVEGVLDRRALLAAPIGEVLLPDQHRRQVHLVGVVDLEVAEEQHTASVEQITECRTRLRVERRARFEPTDLRAEHRGEIPGVELRRLRHRSLSLMRVRASTTHGTGRS